MSENRSPASGHYVDSRRLTLCCLDAPHATSAAFKRIKVGQVVKSRCYPGDLHDLSAAWANRRPRRVFISLFVAHGQSVP